MFNGFIINPAIAGEEGYTILNLTAREEWLGFPNAPQTQMLSFQTRVFRKSHSISRGRSGAKFRKGSSGRVGWGGYLYNDKNGLFERTGGSLSYAYHIYMTNAQLSFGLAGSIFQHQLDRGKLDFKNPETPDISGAVYIPDADFGMYYKRFGFYSGFSVTNLFQTPIIFNVNGNYAYEDFVIRRQYNLWTGQRFESAKPGMAFEPSVMVRASENLSLQIDVNSKLYFNEDYWTGLSFRSNKSIIGMAGASMGRLYFAYAFDYTFNSIRNFSYGSHEIMISLKLGDNRRRYRWMRRY